MAVDQGNIMKRVIIFLFIMNLYNKDIRRRVASAKVINIIANKFKLANNSLLKLKKYEGKVYNEGQEIRNINQIVDISKDIGGPGNIKQPNKSALNKTNKIILNGELAGNKGEFGHLA